MRTKLLAAVLAGFGGFGLNYLFAQGTTAAILGTVTDSSGAPAMVQAMRIEKFVANFAPIPDAITARALLPFKPLMEHGFSLLSRGALGLFPKGRDVGVELTQAAKYWNIDYTLVPSRTDSLARIVVVRGVDRHQVPP